MESIYGILAKYFKHQCSESELNVVKAWKAENPSEFEQLKSIWKLSEGHDYIQFDEKQGWQELKAQIDATSQTTTKNFVRPLYKYLAAASVLIAATLITVQVYNTPNDTELAFDDNLLQNVQNVRGNALESNEKIAQTTLSNGQFVWLNRHSHLEDFGIENNRYLINHVKGTAFFELKPAAEQDVSTYKVHCNGLNIEFDEAVFAVETLHQKTKIFLEKGTLQVITDDLQQLHLKAGQAVLFQDNQLLLLPTFSPNELAWKTANFEFNQTKITAAIELLESHYPVQIDYLAEKIYLLDVSFKGESIETILQYIVDNFPLQLEEVEKDTYYIFSDVSKEKH
jgi:ferric-dicitrate binding protein FerR (iron transport regulator)